MNHFIDADLGGRIWPPFVRELVYNHFQWMSEIVSIKSTGHLASRDNMNNEFMQVII